MIKDTTKGKGRTKTPEVRFNLDIKKGQKSSPLIMAVFRYDGKRLKYSSQHKIDPKYWNAKKQLPIPSYPFYSDLKKDLDDINDAILEIYHDKNDVSIVEFRKLLNIQLNREVEDKGYPTSLLPYFEYYIKRRETLKDRNQRTIYKYKTVLNKLRAFSASQKRDLDFKDMNIDFKEDFVRWMYDETGTDSRNTVNKNLSTLRLVLKAAKKNGVNDYNAFLDVDFMVGRVKTKKIALTDAELSLIEKLDLSDNNRLSKVRDWFLVACYSSLRISDFMSLKREHLIKEDEGYFIRKITEKTNEEVFIPCNDKLLTILEDHDFIPPSMSDQKFNDYLKEVCELAGLTENAILKVDEKGEGVTITKKRFETISSHDGRRYWATSHYLKGYPIALLMQVTGHQKESTFLTYIGISNKEKAKALMKEIKKGHSKIVSIA